MTIFSYDDYKKWFNDLITAMPKKGRGQLTSIAKHLNTSPVIVTQVFKGNRDLTPEQALLLSDFLGLTKIEKQFLILLVNYSRAGSYHYKKMLSEEMLLLKEKGLEIKSHLHQEKELTAEAKSILYSNWYYLAIWSLIAIPEFNNIQIISERLKLSRNKIQEAINFLLKYQLIIEENERLKIGPKLIHLESTSPHIPRHHQNWRLQAFTHYDRMKNESLSYTAPVTLSKADALAIKEKLIKFISESVNTIQDSPSESAYCLCIDWFEF